MRDVAVTLCVCHAHRLRISRVSVACVMHVARMNHLSCGLFVP